MNVKKNPQRRTAFIWVVITLISVMGIFVPHLIGMGYAAWAISFVAFFLAVVGIIVAIIYFWRAHIVDNMVQGKQLLAHWTYTPEEWQKYMEEEFGEEETEKKRLFVVIAVIAAIVGIGWYLFHRDAMFCLLTFGGLILVMGLAAGLSIIFSPYRNRKGQGEVYISRDAVYLPHQLHMWRGLGARLDKAGYEEGHTSRPRLGFEYSTPGYRTRNYGTVRVAVPVGKEEEAKRILEDIRSAHHS